MVCRGTLNGWWTAWERELCCVAVGDVMSTSVLRANKGTIVRRDEAPGDFLLWSWWCYEEG